MQEYEEMVDISLPDFLGKWFRNLKAHIFKVEVTNKSDTAEKLSKAIDGVIKTLKELDTGTKKVEVLNAKSTDLSELLNSVQEVASAVRAIPLPDKIDAVTVKNLTDIKFPEIPAFPKFPEFPKIPEVKFPKVQDVKGDVSVTNLKPLLDGLQVVVDSLSDLKLEMEKSNKEFTSVLATTRGGKTDVSTLATEATLTTLSSIDFATSAKQDDIVTKIDRYSTNHLDDYTTTSVTYIGQEDSSGVWKMVKIDETSNFPVFTYASVSNNPTLTDYTTAWAARTTATYNVYSTAF